MKYEALGAAMGAVIIWPLVGAPVAFSAAVVTIAIFRVIAWLA